ncbi:MAG TPA: hypothetical protein VGE76_10910 [Opitutaceae bacterium]
MNFLEIQLAFPDCRVVAPDEGYAVPTRDWLLGPFWAWFQKDRWARGLTKWERRNDCDNFARAYAQAAQDCHALSNGSDQEGVAVGEFFYTQAKGGGHAIVAAFVDSPARLIFIEPQTGREVTLTPEEQASAFFVRF